ncbi:dihydrodipicolinate synthase family protein [Aureimonas fodinaquatilis]|uniref:Dihydrodipicolinate synthase family protein n=1 Tax=Aureimonas fodinaquatilis TaxID=2565783 RepID=A0A5B0DZI4_9HYPH|nr:dihydrodipicolinate synthase family protein [Aureimonas fodinaquatilis]KAA0971953.1 dihydrodipicolinate synthase family protein [Aureimonas fodinaquatilis]
MTNLTASLAGISGVHVTAYGVDGEIDLAMTASIVSKIAQAGIHNIVSAGNTGEFFSLTDDEVARVHEAAIEGAAGHAVVTASVGRSLREAIHTAKRARTAGADAIMVHHPRDPFAAPQSQADYFIELAEASELPVVAYVRSDTMGIADLRRVAEHPNIPGIKYAGHNVNRLSACIRETTDLDTIWICGLAEGWAAPFYAVGARGFTSGLVNVAPALSLATWNALEAGDYAKAREIVDQIGTFEELRTRYENGTNVTVVKEAMMIMGADVGPVRLPGLPRLEEKDRLTLETLIASWPGDMLVHYR